MNDAALWRRLLAELLGSAFLAAVVVGSGIAAQRLSPGETGLELLENAAATAAGLFAIILMFGPVSGGHFNPVVSFVDAAFGGLPGATPRRTCPRRWPAASGAVQANLMFAGGRGQHLGQAPGHARAFPVRDHRHAGADPGDLRAGPRRAGAGSAPAAVGAYIGAAYFFTSSTSFANPAITIGRMFSDTFAGIAPSSVPPFIAAQIVGGILAVVVIKVAVPRYHPG